MKNIYPYIFVLFFVNLLSSCYTSKLNKANLEMEKMNYSSAIKQYKDLLTIKDDKRLYSLIAESYLKTNNLNQAEEWYRKTVDSGNPKDADYYNLAQVLKSKENYKEAVFYYGKYLELHPNDLSAKNQKESCEKIYLYKLNADAFDVAPLNLNIEGSYFSPAFFDKGIVFCTDHHNNGEVSEWNGRYYLDLYHVTIDSVGNLTEVPHSIGQKINSKFHEGPSVFSKGNSTIYFTRNYIVDDKPVKNKKDENVLKIYSATYQGDEWVDIKPLPFCDDNYTYCHPTLSFDEKILYFSSDMPGGQGGMDLYQIELKDGEWINLKNLGPEINTSDDELFPTMVKTPDWCDFMYFSSRGREGLGGLDIYKTCVNELGGGVQLLPFPINSSSDDFGLIMNPDNLSGYFSSSRDGDGTIDKIYTFKRIMPKFFMEGVVVKKGTSEPIPDANIEIIQSNGSKRYDVKSDNSGKFFIEVDSNSTYSLIGKKEMFFKNTTTSSTMGLKKTDTVFVELILDQIVIDKAIRLDNIYYDYDKWDIRQDAAIELDKLVKIMQENPEINIELSSHTDCRGNDKYNMKLSQKRAESAVNYIISRGILSSRIYAKGYGESKLLNLCDDGIGCTEDEHQLNRRTEFKVVKITN